MDEGDAPVQAAPLEVACLDGAVARLKVDLAIRAGDQLLIAGWSVGELELFVTSDGEVLDTRCQRFERADVAEHFSRPAEEKLGFVLIAQTSDEYPVGIQWTPVGSIASGSQLLSLITADQLAPAEAALLGPARTLLADQYPAFSEQWRRAVATAHVNTSSSLARGFLEAAAVIQGTHHAVLCGWVATEPGATAWVEDDGGHVYPVGPACWRVRNDVFQAVGAELGISALNSGFVLHLQTQAPTTRLRLKVLTRNGVHLLGDIACTTLPPDPVAASRWLFGIATPDGSLAQRVERVDGPILDALIARSQAMWPQLTVTRRDLGQVPRQPKVSVIVPLYGRYDFVESQMLEWSRDPWIRQHAELIYVIDDPALAEPFRAHAEELYRLYKVAFRWVWGGVNRGFSGANNLGATVASGDHLLFLNSDVFPQRAGWLQAMLDVLETRPEVAAVAPRLTFAEGGIQHAGMRFDRLEEYGVWINQHPYMGLDPALDPQRDLTVVPAVTGACLLLRRTDFDKVKGWDTGYLIGDFEDSDLCLKLRDAGMQIAYLPTVQLTHLERQSMMSLGSSEYRSRVTLWNALRHQRRWQGLIEASVEAAL